MATVSYRLEDLKKAIVGIGYVGENDHMHVLIDCKEVFDEYPDAVPTMAIVPPVGEGYPKAVTKNGDVVEWLVKDSDVTVEGDGEFQLTFTEGEIIRKSVNARFRVKRSISGSGSAPSGVQDWLTDANEKLAEVEQATQDAEAAASHQPYIGIDGYWYTWNGEEFVKNVKAHGEKGDPGDPGSPGDPTQLIDDQAGQGTTGKTWSANKLNDQFGGVLNDITEIEDVTIVEKAIHEDEDISSQLTYDASTYVTNAGYRGSSASYKCTEKIPVMEGMIFRTTYMTEWRYVCAYNGDTAIEAKGGTNLFTYTVPAGITHIIITLYSTVNTGSRAVIRKFDKEWKENSLSDELKATESDLESVKGATVEKQIIQKEIDLSEKVSYVTGQYINKTGYNGADAGYNRTNKISVKEGEVYKTSYQTDWRFICAYNGDTVVESAGKEYVRTYTVPEGVTHIVITLVSSLSLTQRAIIKVEPFADYENNAGKIVPSHKERKARVTFIDDDGYAEFYTYFVPIMRTYHVPMVSAYMGDVCPTFKNSTYMTEEQCKEIESLGGEIVVHGGTNLTTLTIAQAEQNVLASKNALTAHGFKSDVYVYPNGGNNIAIREMMAKHFKCAFKTGYPQKYDTRVNDKCVPHYFIHRCSAGGYFDDASSAYGSYDTYSLDYFKALIDDAVTRGGWLVFMTHAWMMPVGCSYRLEHDAGNGVPADLDEFGLIEDIIEYIQTLKANNTDIDIVTASEGFEMFGSEVQAGDYLGYWNETYTGLSNYEHSKAGFAVNKIGDIDFADGNRISHS